MNTKTPSSVLRDNSDMLQTHSGKNSLCDVISEDAKPKRDEASFVRSIFPKYIYNDSFKHVPIHLVEKSDSVPLSLIKARKFDAIDKTVRELGKKLGEEEIRILAAEIEFAQMGTDDFSHIDLNNHAPSMELHIIEEKIRQTEKVAFKVGIIVSGNKFGKTLKQIFSKNLWLMGNKEVVISDSLLPTQIILIKNTEDNAEFGKMVIKKDMTVQSKDNPKSLRLGWSFEEEIGLEINKECFRTMLFYHRENYYSKPLNRKFF